MCNDLQAALDNASDSNRSLTRSDRPVGDGSEATGHFVADRVRSMVSRTSGCCPGPRVDAREAVRLAVAVGRSDVSGADVVSSPGLAGLQATSNRV